METESSFARDFGHSIFNFGVGILLLTLTTLPEWVGFGITGFVVLFSLLALAQFGAFIHFWTIAMDNYDDFKPGGEHNKSAVSMLNHTTNAVFTYRYKELFWIAVTCNVVFMAGLLQHNLWIAFVAEAIAFVIGYSVIRSFLTHFPKYYKLATGKEVSDA